MAHIPGQGGPGQGGAPDPGSGLDPAAGGDTHAARLRHGAEAHRVWREVFGAATFVCAPMVLQSERAFRMLVRQHGCGAAWTPMARTMDWADRRDEVLSDLTGDHPGDRPLVCQLCAVDVAPLVAAALEVQEHCDAVCLNLGCPQRTAERAGFGAFLMDRPDRVHAMIAAMVAALRVPVFAKIRVFRDPERTLGFVRMLESAGCSLVTVHGRTRDNTHHRGPCDWHAIKACREAVCIPVIANGGVHSLDDAERCLSVTGAVAVMAAGGLLRNPRMFGRGPAPAPAPASPQRKGGSRDGASAAAGSGVEQTGLAGDARRAAALQLELAREYLRWAHAYPPPLRHVRDHLLSILRLEIKAGGDAFYSMFARQQRLRTRAQFCLLVSALAAHLGTEGALACSLHDIKVFPNAARPGLSLECRCGVGCVGAAISISGGVSGPEPAPELGVPACWSLFDE